jgi:hypothetical protein
VVVVWIPVDESYRVEIKKFVDAKAPLNMLKYKMQYKSDVDESYKVFHNDIEAVVAQQSQFLESVERKVAEAEAIDPDYWSCLLRREAMSRRCDTRTKMCPRC